LKPALSRISSFHFSIVGHYGSKILVPKSPDNTLVSQLDRATERVGYFQSAKPFRTGAGLLRNFLVAVASKCRRNAARHCSASRDRIAGKNIDE
jgi:hypothetical protein